MPTNHRERTRLRNLHGCSALTYDEQLAIQAQIYAHILAEKNIMVHSHLPDCGENLARKSSTEIAELSATDASLIWYSEILDYKFNGKDQLECGHFSQLVWKDTKFAGFGVAKTADGHSVFVVGQYDPPGNVMGTWGSQVPCPLNRKMVVPTADALCLTSGGPQVLVPTPISQTVQPTASLPATTNNADQKEPDLQKGLLAAHNEFRTERGLEPLSVNFELESLGHRKPAFFENNLGLLSHPNAVIVSAEPEIRIVVGFPCGSENILFFDTTLKFDDQDSTEPPNKDVLLVRYVRHEVLEKESCLAVYVRPPRPGAYILNIAVNRTQNEVAADSETADNLYEDVCEYCLMVKVSPTACLLPFPHEGSGVYGQTKKAKLFNVRAVRREPTVRDIQGNVELRFASIDSKRPLPRLMGELKSAALSGEAMKHCIVQRPLSNSTDFVFSIFLPDAGDFSLEVYANDPQRDGSTFKLIWQYMLIYRTSLVRGLPSMSADYLGPRPKFAELGLSMVSPSDPFIRSDTGEVCVRFAYQENLPLLLSTKLTFVSNDSLEDFSHMILQQTLKNQVHFLLRFPQIGFFKFELYAKPTNDSKASMPNVHNYLIEAYTCHRMDGQVMPFPKQFMFWSRGCYLTAPTEGILGLDENGKLSKNPPHSLPFNVSIPKAVAVAVVVGGKWTELDSMGDCWKGSVQMKQHWGTEKKLTLLAKYAASDTAYSPLLEYPLAV